MLVAITLSVLGCSSAGPAATSSVHTLAGNPRFPTDDMARFFTAEKWQKLREMEYTGYVVMDARILSDGSVALGREIASYPDASWSLLAHALGQRARLHPTTVGTHVDPKAEIYVIFFSRSLDGNLALIFGQQSAGPNLDQQQRSSCLTTTLY